MTEAGPLDMIEVDKGSDDSDDDRNIRLPGVQKGDFYLLNANF